MNKKFYTLVAALFAAGAFVGTVNAQTTLSPSATNLVKEGNIFYISKDAAGSNGQIVANKYLRGSFDGKATATTYTGYAEEAYYQWKLVFAGDLNGTNPAKAFKLQNVATGLYYSVNNDGKESLFSESAILNATDGTNFFTVDKRALSATELNNMNAYKKTFSLQFMSANHQDVYSFENNAFINQNITAIPSEKAFVTFSGGDYNGGETATRMPSVRANKSGVLLKVSGEWNGGAIYEIHDVYAKVSGTLTKGQYVTYDAEQVKKFRASKFIVLSEERYSAFNTDVKGENAKGYKYEIVTGAELLGKVYTPAAASFDKYQAIETINDNAAWAFNRAVANTSAAYYKATDEESSSSAIRPIDNAIFKISIRGTEALTHVNDLLIEQPSAYCFANDTYTQYVADPTQSVNPASVFANVFDFDGAKHICSASNENLDDTHPTFVTNALVGVTVDPQKFLATKKIVNVVYSENSSSVTNAKGKTWNPDKNNNEKLLAKFIDNTKPEGQWLVRYNSDNNTFAFVNSESQKVVPAVDFTKKDWKGYVLFDNGNNDYTAVVYNAKKEPTEEHYLKLTDAVRPDNNMFGYVNMTDDQLDNGFNISVVTDLFNKVYLREDHESDHKATFVKEDDKDVASVWRMVKFDKAKDYAANVEGTDTIRIFNEYTVWNATDKLFENKQDTIEALTYAIYNDYTKEYLKYDSNKKAYYTDPKSADLDARTTDVQKFVLKKKTANEREGINLIPAEIQNDGSVASTWSIYGNPKEGYKLIGSFSENKLTQEVPMYRVVDNDLFSVEPVTAPIYRTMSPVLDTVKIFKDENNSDVLYEKNHFLGMEHVSDVPEMKAAMYVDTAYVRNNPVKPQYLLVVGAKHVVDEEICEIPGHPVHRADTVFGRFLVNMVDSMIATDAKAPHNNPYKFETYPRLAFIEGTHTHDVLSLPSMDKKFDLSKNEDNVATFQFRYVDRESGSFLLETQTKNADGQAVTGWVKWLNGTPVVVDKIELAEVLNLKETSEAPTANDEVAATEVSVVAANGAVIIKNAAGKKVAISNILGKAIANETIASDNETIAVPAGIVVVAVEGEEAVKTVVK